MGDIKGNKYLIPDLTELAFKLGAMVFRQLLLAVPPDSSILSNSFVTPSHSHLQCLTIVDL